MMKVIVPIENFNLNQDTRTLIPVYESGKVGFVDHDGFLVVTPKYDYYRGEFNTEDDFVVVATNYLYAYERKTTAPAAYSRPLYGLINSKGEEVIKTDYFSLVSPLKSSRLYSVQDRTGKYGVVDCNGNTIIPFGKYDYIDGFYKGFARVKLVDADRDNKESWGIINESDEIVIPIEYDNIWNFYNKSYVTLIKDASARSSKSILVDDLDLPF